jgi:hypothetical protein
VLDSHLISKKAVSILLRNPFSTEDFIEFLQERQTTIINAIESLLIKEKLDIPVALKKLDLNIEKIEIALRDFILKTVGRTITDYKEVTPPHIQEKINTRINSELKKNIYLKKEDFIGFDKKITFFTLFELYDVLVSKNGWVNFEPTFINKTQLHVRFNQISSLRNKIRHSRELSSIERLDGEAAIEWFNQVLSIS